MKQNKLLTTPLLLLALLISGIAACEKIEDMIRFSFKDTAKITIPAQSVLPTSDIIIPTPEVQTSSQQAFAQNNTQAKYVKEAKLTELKLSITAPEGETFSFVNELKIYVSASGQQEVMIASKTNISNDVGNVLVMDLANVNLKPYIQGDSYSIRTVATIDELISEEVNINADMTFTVTADVF